MNGYPANTGRAIRANHIATGLINPPNFTFDPHRFDPAYYDAYGNYRPPLSVIDLARRGFHLAAAAKAARDAAGERGLRYYAMRVRF